MDDAEGMVAHMKSRVSRAFVARLRFVLIVGPPVSAGFVAQSRLTPKFLGDAYVDGACFAADRIPAVNNGCEELVEFGHFCASDVFGVSILMMSAIGTHATVELANHDVLVVLLYPGFGEVTCLLYTSPSPRDRG